jgi:outer membrane protein assembly factor BamB
VIARVAVVGILVLALSGCQWFRLTGRDGVEPPAELTELTPTVSMTRLWERSLGDGGARQGLRLSPAFDGSRLYVSDAERGLVALDPANGAVLWTNRDAGGMSSSPGVDRDLVVAGTLEGEVLAAAVTTGATVWKARVTSEVIARPAVSSTTVVVRSNDGRVFGLDPADGRRKWVFDRSVPLLSLRGNAAPLILGGTVLIGFDNGRVFALDLDQGTLLWEQAVAQPEGRTELERMVDLDGPLASDGSQVYAATYRGQVAAIAPDSGRALWSRDASAYGGVARSGTTLVLADSAGTVLALDARNGSGLWSQKALANRFLSTPAIVGAHVVAGDLEGYLHVLRLDDGALAARARLGKEPIRGEPLAVGDVVYAQSSDGRVGAWRIGG